jgi:hypothetical protein
MSNNFATGFTVEEIEIEEDDESRDDFTFVIGANGELKSMYIPEHLMDDPPEEIQCILELFGIDDINMIKGRTLH